jgi:hypothetical protein
LADRSEVLKLATATAVSNSVEGPASILAKLVYPAAVLASLSVWFLAVRAPLWVDETLAYWQISGGFPKVWSRSALMPSSFAYLYILWFTKSALGSQEVALRLPSILAMLAAAYCLFRAAQELFGSEIAFIAAILFCVHADVVFAATDARPYAFALLVTNLAILALVRWTARNEMRYAILCGASAAGILYFHYLFGAILPAFAIYYLLLRRRSIRADAAQIAASLSSFVLVAAPLVPRFVELFRTRQLHTFAGDPNTWFVLRTLVPFKLLVIFVGTVFVAALIRKVKLPGRECSLAVLLCPLLALVPTAILYGISAATPMRVFIPRYCLVAVPGSALTWGFLISWIDSRWLRGICCGGLVAWTMFQYFTSPLARLHEMNFKQAHAFVNANVANDKATVLTCSAFIEANFGPMPTDLTSENALVSQLSYYPIDAPVILLPYSLNDETIRIASQAVLAAAQRHQRFLVVGSPVCYRTMGWLANYSRGAFTAQPIGDFDEIVVVEFRPVAGSE